VGGVVGNYEVTLKDKDGIETKEIVGSIVVATGAVPFTPVGMFGYDGKNVITQIELEEMLRDNKFISKKRSHDPVCGRAFRGAEILFQDLLRYSRKECALHQERDPEAHVNILYRDIQMYGTENEKLLWESRGEGVRFDVYDAAVPPVVKDGVVEFYQPLTGMTVEIPYDLVVLSTPLVAPSDSQAIANLMRIP